MIKRELNILFSSILYFTRLPLPFKVEYRKEYQQLSLSWFPLIGWMVGGLSALVFYLSMMVLPQSVSVLIALGAGVLITGAFHEDGFADICDAFGGGYTKEQRLTIMKDSRVGAYALIGVVLFMGLKIALLIELEAFFIPLILIAAHSVSRWSSLVVAMFWPYARPTGESKSRDVNRALSYGRFLWAFLLGVIPLLLFGSWWVFLSIPVVVVSSFLAGIWFSKRIGGYTGDCMGALQQVNEVIVLLFFVILMGQ